MARAIDGDALKQWCEKIIGQACHPATVQIGEVFLDKVRSMPTLTTHQAENAKLRAELEQVKAERDAAVEDFRTHRKYKCDCCYYADKQSRFPCTECQSPISTYGDGWKWRGPQKED